MFQVDEKPETIHLYVVREEEPRPSVLPIVASILLLLCVIAVGTLFPYYQPVEHKTLRVPAIFLPLKSFTASAPIIPTGIKTYPATSAYGILTITNGSVISQTLPQGFTIDGVATDNAVFVPAGSANGYGHATVQAHALLSGNAGNLPTLAINQVEGSSVYIRNLQPFTGGKDAYSVSFATSTDKANALEALRIRLTAQISAGILAEPCKESVIGNKTLLVTWLCQFITLKPLNIPNVRITGIRVEGKNLIVGVVFVARPRRIETK